MNNAPIGVFDSGLGGLSVWCQLRRVLPRESFVYYGDGKNCPYGNKSREEIIAYTDFAVKRLLEEDRVKMVVVACNTATAMAIDHLRSTFSIPFVGLEPAVKPAALASRSGVIGILATAAALQGRHFRDTAARYEDRVKIIARTGEGLVELVEEDREESPEALERVTSYVRPMVEAGADHLVLGCTHYPFLAGTIRKAVGTSGIHIIDSSEAVSRRVETLLDDLDLAAGPDHVPTFAFRTSGDEAYRQKLIAKSRSACDTLLLE